MLRFENWILLGPSEVTNAFKILSHVLDLPGRLEHLPELQSLANQISKTSMHSRFYCFFYLLLYH